MAGYAWEYEREFTLEHLRGEVRNVTIPILVAGPYPSKNEREREGEADFAERQAREFLEGAEWTGLEAGDAVAAWDEVAGEVAERFKRFREALAEEEKRRAEGKAGGVAGMGSAVASADGKEGVRE